MKTVILLLTSVLNFQTPSAFAARDTGGGASVYCKANLEKGFAKEGYYSLDYALTTKNNQQNQEMPNQLEAIFNKIARGLVHLPPMEKRFKLFRSQLNNTTFWDREHRYVWSDAAAVLPATNDQNMDRALPINCQNSSGQSTELFQVTTRKQINDDVINFEIEQDRLDQLKNTSDLQLSYHLIHEFLRDFAQDVLVIRRVNRLFHDPVFDTMSEAALAQTLNNMGLKTAKTSVANDIDKSVRQRWEAELALGLSADTKTRFQKIMDEYAEVQLDTSHLPAAIDSKSIYSCGFSYQDGTTKATKLELNRTGSSSYAFWFLDSFSSSNYDFRIIETATEESAENRIAGQSMRYAGGIPQVIRNYDRTANANISIRVSSDNNIFGVIEVTETSGGMLMRSKSQTIVQSVFKCTPGSTRTNGN